MGTDEARATLAAIPVLAGYDGPLERLGGLTNLVFKAGDFCLRIPGKGTEEYINRANEAVAAREAAKAGVSPEVLHVDATDRRDGDAASSPAPRRCRRKSSSCAPGSPARAGEAFRKLHTSGAVFPFRFELFAMIDDYLKVLSTKDVALPRRLPRRGARGRQPCARRLPRIRCRLSPATAIRCARIFSIRASGCGSSTGNIRG